MSPNSKVLEGLAIRRGNGSHLWSLHWLRSLAGWNQSLGLWKVFLVDPSSRVFVARCRGAVVGSATLWTYGSRLGWIGMVIVHPAYRRRGIAKSLLQTCLNCGQQEGIESLGLDATPSGRPLYRALGFVEGERLDRWFLAPSKRARGKRYDDGEGGFLWDEAHFLNAMEEGWDRRSFGVGRRELLKSLIPDSKATLVIRGGGSELNGYGLLRRGAVYDYLGPVIAAEESFGRAVVSALLSKAGSEGVYWDIPAGNAQACALAESLGFRSQRPLYRMWRPKPLDAAWADRVWAIVDPALG